MSSHFDAAQAAQKIRLSRQALDQAISDWNQAGTVWDSMALASVYCEEGMLFGGRPGHFVGREAIRRYFASYDGVILAGTMSMSELIVHTPADGCVLAQGMVNFSFTLAGSRRTRSVLRATLVLQREPGGWGILSHHFSAIPDAPPLGTD